MKIICHFLNPIITFFLIKEFVLNEPPNPLLLLLLILVLSAYSIVTHIYHNKWNKIAYYTLFSIIHFLTLLSFPIGMTFALIGGYILTAKIFFFFYMPPLLLIIFNLKEIMYLKNAK